MSIKIKIWYWKYIYVVFFIFIFTIGLVSSTIYLYSESSAVNSMISFKNQRESLIERDLQQITYTTDKVCSPNYNDPYTSNCHICFTFDDDVLGEMCVQLNPGTSYDQDLEIIEREARDRIGNLYPMERFEYKEYDKQGVVANV